MSKHKLRLMQLKERNDLRGEQMNETRARFSALDSRHENGTAPKAVSAFNLFQTPADIARDMVKVLNVTHDMHVLEPSAGLGRLLDELPALCPKTAVEESAELCQHLFNQERIGGHPAIICRDFLSVHVGELGQFDRIIMNPPFKMGRDIKHIMHAFDMLAPGGRLVALCYDGVKQNNKLKPWADEWHPLGSAFKAEGTKAPVVMLIKNRPA